MFYIGMLMKTILKVLLAIAYFLFCFIGVLLITEDILLEIIFETDVAFVFCSDMYVIYYVVGLCVFGVFVWLYSKHGVFAQFTIGTWEEGIKANLPVREKRKIAGISLGVLIFTAILPLFWYNCFLEDGIEVRRFFWKKTYTWEDVDYYTLSTKFDNTLKFSVVLKSQKEMSLDGIVCTLERLPEEDYPNGIEDFWCYLAGKFVDRGIPLVVEDWEKLEQDLEYDYSREVVGKIRLLSEKG